MTHSLILPNNLPVGSINAYFDAVGQLPQLSADEERALAVRFRDNEDIDAARQLVMANLRFVVHIARGYNGYGLALPDLVQEGNIGLMKAVKRFDSTMGVRLVSFAVHWIRAEIHEFVIRNWRIVKIATTKAQRKLFFNLRKSKKRLGWFSRDEAAAVADDLGVKIETVLEMEKRLDNYDMAFDGPDDASNDDYAVFAPASYVQQREADPAELIEQSESSSYEQRQLTQALDALDERSKDILTRRWLSDKKQTLHDLAARHGVSAERIRQLEKNALKKLKNSMLENV